MYRRFTIILVFAAVLLAFSVWTSFRVGSHVVLYTPKGEAIALTVADTPAAREKGLGGRPSLKENEGMLFVFSEPGRYGIWMKDMRFPLDIIWLEERMGTKVKERMSTSVRWMNTKRELAVVDVRENIAPSTYPEVLVPKKEALYALEVNAGAAAALGITQGAALSICSQDRVVSFLRKQKSRPCTESGFPFPRE